MLIVMLHFVGVFISLAVIMFVSGSIDGYMGRKRREQVFEAALVKLDLPRDRVLAGEYKSEIARYLADRYDADRVINRISDVVQPGFIVLEILSYAVQLIVVAIVAWFVFTDDPVYAASAWFAVVAAIAFWIINLVASGFLYLATGRVPGEARNARCLSVQIRNNENRSPTSSSSGLGKI